MVLGDSDGPIIGAFDTDDMDIKMTLVTHREPNQDNWFGFSMQFPLAQDNEDNGFGQIHEGESYLTSTSQV